MRDDVTNSIAVLIGAQNQKQMNFFAQTSPLSGGNYKFQMIVQTMDGGDDTVLEEWDFEGCLLAEVNYEEFDYSSSEAMTVVMSVRYDNVTQACGLLPPNPTLTYSAGGLSF